MLRQLEIDLTQLGGIMSSPNLQKRTALFKDLCSKLLASWCNDSAQCIAAVRGLRLQAGYSAVQMYNLEVLAVAPSPLPYYTVACINLHMPHFCHMRKGLREKLYRYSRTGLAGLWLPLAFAPYARLAQSRG